MVLGLQPFAVKLGGCAINDMLVRGTGRRWMERAGRRFGKEISAVQIFGDKYSVHCRYLVT